MFKKENDIDLLELISTLTETSDPILYQYFKSLKENKLLITNEIDGNAIEMYVVPLKQMDEDPTVEHIHIYLNTIGGSIFEGMTIAETISKLKTPTTVEILSYAYSMGAYIAIAGISNPNVKVVCHEFSTLLFHAGRTQLAGDSSAVDDTIEFFKKFNDKMNDFILRNSKITKKKLNEMKRIEWYLTSDDMLKYGLVEEII